MMRSLTFALSLFLICVPITFGRAGIIQKFKENNSFGYFSGILGSRGISCYSLKGYSVCTHLRWGNCNCGSECDQLRDCVCKACASDAVEDTKTIEGMTIDSGDAEDIGENYYGFDIIAEGDEETVGGEPSDADISWMHDLINETEEKDDKDVEDTIIEGIIIERARKQVAGESTEGHDIVDSIDEGEDETVGEDEMGPSNTDISWMHELRNEMKEKVDEVVQDVVHLVEEDAPKVETLLNETMHKVEDKIIHVYNETKPVLHRVGSEVVTVVKNGEDFIKKESEVVGGAIKSSMSWVSDTFHFLKIVMEVVLIIAVGFVLIKLKRSVEEFMGPNNPPTGNYGNNITNSQAGISSIIKIVDYSKNNMKEEGFEKRA